ncbi:PLP-dependent transferase [Xylariaceae sp. FL1272]|nr:PLP-dependent transferase [Xylariaceae sp. FL1272]
MQHVANNSLSSSSCTYQLKYSVPSAAISAAAMPREGVSLEETMETLLARRKSHNKLRRLTAVPPGAVDFSSNSYLSLSSNASIQKAFVSELQDATGDDVETGAPRASVLGSGGSRLLDGNSAYAEELERNIAAFHGAQAGLLFNSAFDANIGLLSCVPQPGDVILYDELIHASVHDGMRLSRAGQRLPFSHASVTDDVWGVDVGNGEDPGSSGVAVKGLDQVLEQITSGVEGARVRSGNLNVFVCVEGMYSMDGDIVDLKRVCEVVEQRLPLGNGYIIVDEAHSIGVLGERGRGLVSELGLESRIWARVLGFGKAMSCAGGIVLCSSVTRSYLINYARSLIYTTSMAFPSLASIRVIYDYIATGQAEPLRRHLRDLIRHTHEELLRLYSRQSPPSSIMRIQQSLPLSPIIPLLTSHPRSLAEYCQKSGYMIRPIVAPTVPIGKERVRICLHAGNTFEQVQGLCKVIEAWVQQRIDLETGATSVESLMFSAQERSKL